jgi:hypothetical protein
MRGALRAKTHLQHVITAAAVNLVRIAEVVPVKLV